MVFSSYTFVLVFLPIVLGGFLALQKSKRAACFYWLFAVSVVFYCWWSLTHAAILAASVIANFYIGKRIESLRPTGRGKTEYIAGITANLALLAWCKYAGFFAMTVNELAHTQIPVLQFALPLAISFYTFQQIEYLAEVYHTQKASPKLLNYSLFVVFFPHLIAGPIVHHRELLPQLENKRRLQLTWTNFSVGASMFSVGLAKKVIIADEASRFAVQAFGATATGAAIPATVAWAGALAYTIQIYFDFSGYSDMAIGLARFFGVKLPINFDSPYKAGDLIEFWRRWHITLSRFLRDFLYIPLGGNRKGEVRRQTNLLLTMLIGGLWHGASWVFVIWGGLHGLGLVINHFFRAHFPEKYGGAPRRIFMWALTFLFVVHAWIFFRAPDLRSAWLYLQCMYDQAPAAATLNTELTVKPLRAAFFGVALLIAFTFPNTSQLFRHFKPVLEWRALRKQPLEWWDRIGLVWRPTPFWAILCAAAALVSLLLTYRGEDFIYFRF